MPPGIMGQSRHLRLRSVAEVEVDDWMVHEVSPDPWVVDDYGDVQGGKVIGWTNAGEHEDLQGIVEGEIRLGSVSSTYLRCMNGPGPAPSNRC